jgi:hyperosmotically inducible protein
MTPAPGVKRGRSAYSPETEGWHGLLTTPLPPEQDKVNSRTHGLGSNPPAGPPRCGCFAASYEFSAVPSISRYNEMTTASRESLQFGHRRLQRFRRGQRCLGPITITAQIHLVAPESVSGFRALFAVASEHSNGSTFARSNSYHWTHRRPRHNAQPVQFINRRESKMKIRVLTLAFLTAVASRAVLAAGESAPQVEVTAPGRDDAAIAAEVREGIHEQPSLKFFNISVRSVNHTVYLEGQVDTRLDASEAGDVAQAVPGVKKVYNDLYQLNS